MIAPPPARRGLAGPRSPISGTPPWSCSTGYGVRNLEPSVLANCSCAVDGVARLAGRAPCLVAGDLASEDREPARAHGAAATACPRRRAPSVRIAAVRWFLTVWRLMCRRSAISSLLMPFATSRRISSCRGLNAAPPFRSGGPAERQFTVRARDALRYWLGRSATVSISGSSPSATRRIASTKLARPFVVSDVGACSCLHRAEDRFVVVLAADDHEGAVGRLPPQLAGGFDRGGVRQVDVDDNEDVGCLVGPLETSAASSVVRTDATTSKSSSRSSIARTAAPWIARGSTEDEPNQARIEVLVSGTVRPCVRASSLFPLLASGRTFPFRSSGSVDSAKGERGGVHRNPCRSGGLASHRHRIGRSPARCALGWERNPPPNPIDVCASSARCALP